MASIVSLGWDVGGWLGKRQAIAAFVSESTASRAAWLGVSDPFRFRTGEPLNLNSLIVSVLGAEVAEAVAKAEQVVVAIDAPLAFSDGFRNHLSDTSSVPIPPPREIDSPLAYRDCERWVAEQFWKPLSAAFDKLGNNATLAMSLARSLHADGFGLVPFHPGRFDCRVIEVYPAILKEAQRTNAEAIPPVRGLLPPDLECGTDRYDAALCAVLGLAYSAGGAYLDLPDVVGPPEGFPRTDTEGWIFGLPADFVLGFH